MDAYGPYPFKELPHDYDEAVKRYGRRVRPEERHAAVALEEIYTKLVEAFTQKAPYSRDNIQALFVGDGALRGRRAPAVPRRASNYDGQLTGQWGIHSRFESELFERYESTLQLSPTLPASIGNPREFIFATLTASFPLVQPVLDADKAAVAGREFYDDVYFDKFFARVKTDPRETTVGLDRGRGGDDYRRMGRGRPAGAPRRRSERASHVRRRSAVVPELWPRHVVALHLHR